MAKNLNQFQSDVALVLTDKPTDLSAQARITDRGSVQIEFDSSDLVEIRSLRDWLTGVLG